MKIHFYSDPHLGTNRRANTTVASREKLQDVIHGMLYTLTQKPGKHVLLGDLFDTYRVPEEVMLQALTCLDGIDLALAGNHDILNDADAVGSMQLMAEIFPGAIKHNAYNEAKWHFDLYEGGTGIWAIPHCTTQALFEEALQGAMEGAESNTGGTKILLLHCNYNRPPEFMSETELNLSQEDALILMDIFDYVLLGHEHESNTVISTKTKGVLEVIGNTFPTSFSDISDKRSLVFDTKTRTMESVTHWTAADHSLEVQWNGLPENLDGIQFLNLTGKVASEEIFQMSEVVRTAWAAGDDLLAVRDSTVPEGGSFHVELGSTEEVLRQESFEGFIAARLPTDLKTIFKEVRDATRT